MTGANGMSFAKRYIRRDSRGGFIESLPETATISNGVRLHSLGSRKTRLKAPGAANR